MFFTMVERNMENYMYSKYYIPELYQTALWIVYILVFFKIHNYPCLM